MDEFDQMHMILETKIKEISVLKQALEKELNAAQSRQNQQQFRSQVSSFISLVSACKTMVSDLKSIANFQALTSLMKEVYSQEVRTLYINNSDLKEEVQRLRSDLLQQQKLNTIMNSQVLDLKEMIGLQVQKFQKDIQAKNQIIGVLTLRNAQIDTLDGGKFQQVTTDQIRQKHQHLETINQQEEVNLTSRVFNPEDNRVKVSSRMSVSATSDQSQQTLVNTLVNTQRVQSSRKTSDSKTRARFFIEDFRNVVQKTEGCLEESVRSYFNHSKLTQSNIECCSQSETVSVFDVQSRMYGMGDAHKRNDSSDLVQQSVHGFRRHNSKQIRTQSKQKISLTHIQKTPQLKVRDCNIISHPGDRSLPRKRNHQNLDQKLKLVSIQKKNSNGQTRNTCKWIIENLQKIDLYVGDKRTQQHYEGTTKDNCRHGWGRLQYINGLVFQGQFRENVRHGYGTLSLNGKQIYQGGWQRDKLSGEGVLHNIHLINKRKIPETSFLRGGSHFSGSFWQNCFHGRGVLFLNQLERFQGEFNRGLPSGQFAYFNKHEQVENGYCDAQFFVI